MSDISKQTWEDLAIERLREYRREFERLSDRLWPIIQDLGEFLEGYDEWKKETDDDD